MRTIYFCRHAKSSWDDPRMRDFDRPLNDRGLHNAPMMARKFSEKNEPVDLLITSPAVRALSTARYFARELGMPEESLVKEPMIYEASVATLLKLINVLPSDQGSVLFFGHNPGFTEIIEYLSGDAIGNLPTCGMARIDVDVDDWMAVSRGNGRLVWRDHPKRHEC